MCTRDVADVEWNQSKVEIDSSSANNTVDGETGWWFSFPGFRLARLGSPTLHPRLENFATSPLPFVAKMTQTLQLKTLLLSLNTLPFG